MTARVRGAGMGLAAFAVALSFLAARLVVNPRGTSLAIPLALGVLVAGIGFAAPRVLLYALVPWLTLLGFLRRVFPSLDQVALGNPLLLVGPIGVVILVLVAGRTGAFTRRTTLANGVVVLSLFVVVGAANPLQGRPLVGAAGLIFMLIPLLTFWVGRAFCDDRVLTRVLMLVAGLGLLVALYGLVQTLVGFPHWDAVWIAEKRTTFLALIVNDKVVRPFATFPSPAEYSFFLALALIAWVGISRRLAALPAALAVIGLLVTAIVLASSRTIVVLLVFTLGLVVGARRRLRLSSAAILGAVLLVLVPFAAAQVVTSDNSGGTSTLVSHQVAGLANPLNPQDSTLPGHLTLFIGGLKRAVHDPLGSGTGTVTVAAGRYGGTERGTDQDPSNVAAALGLPGLVAYVVVLLAGLGSAYRLASRRRDVLSAMALAILGVTLFQWLNGGHYAVALITWLVIGWVDRETVAFQRSGRGLGVDSGPV
jgi:hypothetical protein